MPPAERRGGAAHGVEIEPPRFSIYVLSLEHARRVAVPDAVDIRFPHRGESGVKPLRRFFERDRPDVLRQIRAQQRQNLRAAFLRFRPERADLPPGMDARVRASAAGNLHRLLQRTGEQRFELALHRLGGVALLLPAAVARAVIRERQFEIWHLPLPFSSPDQYTIFRSAVHRCFGESAPFFRFVYIFPGICSWNVHSLISLPGIIASYRTSGVQPPNDLNASILI